MNKIIRDNSKRSNNILIAFLVFSIIYVASISISLYQNSVLRDHPNAIDKIEFTDLLVGLVGIAQTIIFIVCIVLFLRWIRRAYGNLIRLNYYPLDYSETGSVWGYFIPFVNWVRPISTTKEIFINTQRAIKKHNSNYQMQQDSSFIIFWWVAYLINGAIGRYASKQYNKAFDIESYIEANNIMVVSDVISFIPLALVIYLIVKLSKLETLLLETYLSNKEINTIGIEEH